MFKINKIGATRIVILFSKVAVKIPTFKNWEMFLYGLLGNIQERRFRKMYPKETERALPPVLFSLPGGFLVIQKRVRPVRHKGFFFLALAEVIATSSLDAEFWKNDPKMENFGYLENRLVKVDIGTRY
jgi:hypothetical protein